MRGVLLFLILFYYSSSSLALAGNNKRAPPFPQATDLPVRLGNYTHSHENVERPTYTCTSLGECDICTSLEKKTASYCLDYGNKEPVQCEWDNPNWVVNRNDTMTDDDAINLPTFRACPWVKRVEKWRIIKFETMNFILAVISVSVFLWRQRKLAKEKYQQMAQRIGVA
ncbi:unnamed protein product [Absidia cylindrospora]